MSPLTLPVGPLAIARLLVCYSVHSDTGSRPRQLLTTVILGILARGAQRGRGLIESAGLVAGVRAIPDRRGPSPLLNRFG